MDLNGFKTRRKIMCGVSCGEMAVSFECYFYTSTVYFHIGDKKKSFSDFDIA